MQDKPVEEEHDGFLVSFDASHLDHNWIHAALSERSYWAQGRPREVQEQAIAHSLNVGIYRPASDGALTQVAYARVVTDYATFGWLCDVFVDEAERGHGLGKLLVRSVVAHPTLAGIRRLILATRDAHSLYIKNGGFAPLERSHHYLARIQSPSDPSPQVKPVTNQTHA